MKTGFGLIQVLSSGADSEEGHIGYNFPSTTSFFASPFRFSQDKHCAVDLLSAPCAYLLVKGFAH